MDKAPDAFRTISEVADVLDTPAHVLRFWESRFPQIRPIKRAGGRRYYRPGDVALLAGIRHLLHDQGLTIRGVQKILRESGVRHVQSLVRGEMPGLGDISEAAEIEAALDAEFLADIEPERIMPLPEAEIVPLPQRGPRNPEPVERMRAEAPPPANAPYFAEEVPEAPFIEAEDSGMPAEAEVHRLNPASGRGAAATRDLFAEDESLPSEAEEEDEPDLPADLQADLAALEARLAEAEDEDLDLDLEDLALLDGVPPDGDDRALRDIVPPDEGDLGDLALLDSLPEDDDSDLPAASSAVLSELAPESPPAPAAPPLVLGGAAKRPAAPEDEVMPIARRLRALPRPVAASERLVLAEALERARAALAARGAATKPQS